MTLRHTASNSSKGGDSGSESNGSNNGTSNGFYLGGNFDNENYAIDRGGNETQAPLSQGETNNQQQTTSQTPATSPLSSPASPLVIDTSVEIGDGTGTSTVHSAIVSSSTAPCTKQHRYHASLAMPSQYSPSEVTNKTTATTNVTQYDADEDSVSASSSTEATSQPDGPNVLSHGVLGDLTNIANLTTEERNKLEEIRMKRFRLFQEIQKLKEEISSVKKEMSRMEMTVNGDGSSNGSASKEDNSAQRAKQLSIGKKKFNMDPKKGIEYLVKNNLLKETPEEIATFLYKGEGLNKTAIGTYLGEKLDFNLRVLDAFIELHDFKNLLLVQALRQFLWSFRLPGEAQKIDRMMEKFAARYCQQNPGVFVDTDTCFVLSFSIIMLNTSLHNPNVKEKTTAEKFIQMNRGINNGGDLPRELLFSLYENIRQEPFKIPEDDGNDLMHTFFNPDREGWLWKQGGRYKGWKRRWFILKDKCLYYFEYTTDKEPRGIIPLENVDVKEISDRGGRQHCFEIYSTVGDVIKACKTDTEGRVIEGKHTVYRMSSATVEEKDAWVAGIRASVSRSPFYEMLAARKRKAQHNK